MCKTLTLGSLFDGSGGFPLAGVMCGIAPIWASEIDPFCISVTSKRFPKMTHLGSITEINGAEIPPVDVITFGSPCQDLSVAGRRAGLDGERSGLFIEAVRIIKEMRGATNGEYPKYIVWENVPGAFSSNKGEDFRTVIEEIIKIKNTNVSIPQPPRGKWQTAGCIMGDGYSLAWRVLDAQFWGVPQRRKRVFLVGSFGNESAAEILFKREGLRGNFKESRKAWKGLAPDTENDTYLPSGEFTPKTLKIRCGCEGGGKGALIQENKSATLSCNNDQVLFSQNISSYTAGFKGKAGSKAGSVGYSEKVSPTLQAEQEAHCLYDTVVFDRGQITSKTNRSNPQINDPCHTLTATSESPVLCASFYPQMKAESQCFTENVANTLVNGTNAGFQNAVLAPKIVLNDQGGNSISVKNDVVPILRAEAHGNEPCVVYDGRGNGNGQIAPTIAGDHFGRSGDFSAVCIAGNTIDRLPQNGGNGKGVITEQSYTLNTVDRHAVMSPIYSLDRAAFNQGENAQYNISVDEDTAQTLTAKGPSAVCCNSEISLFENHGMDGRYAGPLDVAPTVQEAYGMGGNTTPFVTEKPIDLSTYVVRRITPLECCRLQGFPDWWCSDIPHKDTPEYRMWGNGVALPCVLYVLEGISELLRRAQK